MSDRVETSYLWAERVYRLIAEGANIEAMTEMRDRLSYLRPVDAELRLAASIRASREREAANV